MVSFFCVLAPEGRNAIVFGEGWGRRQNVVAYSDAIFTMLNLFSSFTDDKMISQAITVHDKFIIILLQYIIFPSERYTFRTSSSLLTSPLYLPKDYCIHSRAKTQKRKRLIVADVMLNSFLLESKHRK